MRLEKGHNTVMKLTGRLLKECKRTDSLIHDILPDGIQRDEDILKYFQLGYGSDQNGEQTTFRQQYLFNYFFLTGDFYWARSAFYYRTISYKIRTTPLNMLYRGLDEEIYQKYFTKIRDLQEENMNIFSLYQDYLFLFPVFSDREDFHSLDDKIHKPMEFWLDFSPRTDKEWPHEVFGRSPYWQEYVLWLVVHGDWERIESTLVEPLAWLEFQEETKKQYSYSIDQHYPIKLFLRSFKYWLLARHEPDNRIKHVQDAMKAFMQWFLRQRITGEDSHLSLTLFPVEIFLSIVMRLDLGEDLEPCKSFIRYFKPLLMAVPFVRDKIEDLNVDYETPSFLSDEEVARLLEEYKKESPARREFLRERTLARIRRQAGQ